MEVAEGEVCVDVELGEVGAGQFEADFFFELVLLRNLELGYLPLCLLLETLRDVLGFARFHLGDSRLVGLLPQHQRVDRWNAVLLAAAHMQLLLQLLVQVCAFA